MPMMQVPDSLELRAAPGASRQCWAVSSIPGGFEMLFIIISILKEFFLLHLCLVRYDPAKLAALVAT